MPSTKKKLRAKNARTSKTTLKGGKRDHLSLYPPSVELVDLHSELRFTNSLLKSAKDWGPRLLIEAPNIDHKDCIARLVKKEAELKQQYRPLSVIPGSGLWQGEQPPRHDRRQLSVL